MFSDFSRRLIHKSHRAKQKLIGTTKVAVDSRIPLITFYSELSNWGDALNPVLVKHISGRDPVAVGDAYNFRGRPVYSVIGSILGETWTNLSNIEVWGSGFISADRIFRTAPNKIHAVRGPLTRKLILAQGLPCPAVYGDPALLYPRYYAPKVKREYDLGIVAHYFDRDNPWVRRATLETNVLNIDVLGGVKEFVDQMCRCRFVASSSLHGLIAADAYGIPFTWLSLSDRVIGHGFKFRDYLMSTGRHDVRPLQPSEQTSIREICDSAIDSKPAIDLDLLLQVCPFARL